MAKDDKEKIGFHMDEGVYCFTHMPKELKNFIATLQRMMEKEGKFLGHMVTKGGLRADPEIIQLAELKHLLRETRTRMETTKEAGWKNEAEEALLRIKRKLGKLQTLAIPKEGETLMIQALIHTTRSLRTIFRKHKVKVVTDGPIEEILKLPRKEGRLAKWATEIHTYDISYIPRKEAKGLVIKKFFDQGEQVDGTPDANKGGTFTLSKKLQAKLTLKPKGLAASTNQGMKDLHVFIYSLTLVAQVEGSYTPEVSVGTKTRPLVKETSSSKKGKAASNAPRADPNYNHEASGSN
nr:hypothetical protein [Tanacetum cinerariifolium]